MVSSLPLYNQTNYSKEELIADVSGRVDPVGLTTILGAYDMASSVHEFQMRDDTTPYFWHISRVPRIIIHELDLVNSDLIAAALLHDVLEDSEIITAEVIKYNFSAYIAYVVEVLTKKLRLMGVPRQQENREYLERLSFASIDCKIIKFAERLDNFRCLEFGVKRNPFDYIEETERDYFPMLELTESAHLEYLASEMKSIKRKLFS